MAVTEQKNLIRIAVLRCFDLPGDIAQVRGHFEDVFRSWLETSSSARKQRKPSQDQVKFQVRGWEVTLNQFPSTLEDIDVLIITGSTASAYDKDPWIIKLQSFLQDVYENHPHIKIFGGCFGHQLVAQALLGRDGVRVEKSPHGWELGVHEVDVTDAFASHFPDLLTDRRLSYQFVHADHVVMDGENPSLPTPWIPLGKSQLCQIQGLLYPRRVLTYQGHPEFDQFMMRLTVKSLGDSGTLSPMEAEKSLQLVNRDDRAILAGEVAIEFMLS